MDRAILLLGGGIDSTTALAILTREMRTRVTALIFDYGQTLQREIVVARQNAVAYGAEYRVVQAPLGWLDPGPGAGVDSGCAILRGSDAKLPMGRTVEQIAEQGTPPSYVPFRNGIFLAYAVAYGEAAGIRDIYCGGNGLYSGNYWDDTLEFAQAFQQAAELGTAPLYRPVIHFPFAKWAKGQIVEAGLRFGVDYSKTWSCYGDGPVHCGGCDSCVQRGHALAQNGLNIHGTRAGKG